MALRRNYKEIIELLNQASGGAKPTPAPAPAPVTAVPPPEEIKPPSKRTQSVSSSKEATTPKEEPTKVTESEKPSPPLSKVAAARAAAEKAAQQAASPGPAVTTNPQASTSVSSSSTNSVVHQSSSVSLPVHASSPISSSVIHSTAHSGTTSTTHANPNSNDVLFWSSKDVADFLSSVGFAEYRENFLSNHVSGRDFYDLSLADNGLQLMKSELGIHSYGNRKQILRQISNLQQFKSVESHLPSFVLVRDSNSHSPFSSVQILSTSFV